MTCCARSRRNSTRDTLFVCSDHGQIDQGGHGGQEPITLLEPFVLAGAGVRPGRYDDVNMTDVAPTLAALLGTNIPASNQGRVLTDMLELTQEQTGSIQRALEAQQSQLLARYQDAIGRQVAPEPGADAVAAHQAALEAARNARLRAERLPRGILALAAGLLPAALIFRMRGRERAWLLGGAALYAILFNFRYAVLDGRTYSLSSVLDPYELIQYCAATTLIALAASWLVSSLGLKTFTRGARRASGLVLGLTLITAYVLSFPVLWSYALNGATVTWALPDTGSIFLAEVNNG
ncbi:MAG: hypothetical protein ACE5GO_09320, partial [Anaerolineales bacterium]